MPGPACYGKGGTEPTVTDCALVLGFIDPDYFLGGAMQLDARRPRARCRSGGRRAARPHARGGGGRGDRPSPPRTWCRPIEEITVNQGIDPRGAVLVGGGGAAGLNAVAIARRLGCTPC